MIFGAQKPWVSYGLISAQFGLLGLLLLPGPYIAHQAWWFLQAFAVFIGLWALAVVELRHLNIIPDPKPGSRLICSGPFRFVRHPMYLSLLLYTLSLVMTTDSNLRWMLWLALLATLLVKLHYEESLLRNHLPDYATYQQNTHKLIPYLY